MKICVIGGGSWGTALANLLAKKNYDVSLYVRSKKLLGILNEKRINEIYLPRVRLCPQLEFTSSVDECLSQAEIVVLAVPADSQKRYGKGSNYYIMDCSAAIQNMLLMAHGLGLGAVWVGAFSKKAVREQLDIPDIYEVFALIPMGYYSNEDSVKFDGGIFSNRERSRRKNLNEIAFAEDLDNPWIIKPEEI